MGRTVAPLDAPFQTLGSGSIGGTWSWVVGGVAILALLISTLRGRAKRQRLEFPVKPLWAEGVTLLVSIGLIAGFVVLMNAYTQPRSDIPAGDSRTCADYDCHRPADELCGEPDPLRALRLRARR